jgi:pyrroline-5-carboxylate reductase
MNLENTKISIIGAGNIGTAIINGFIRSGKINKSNLWLTRRNTSMIEKYEAQGLNISTNNQEAAKNTEIIIVAVLPKQLKQVLTDLATVLDPSRHILVSVVTALSIEEMKNIGGKDLPIVRAMPNTAIAVGESMTCLSSDPADEQSLAKVKELFALAGNTLVITEDLMGSATILGACGIAFFMRYIRAASQGGIQVGFHSHDALKIATQTALGATRLLMETGNHPETEIEKVTTPMGCTIAGLNEMEHNGLSSALIKGIVKSYNEIHKLQ